MANNLPAELREAFSGPSIDFTRIRFRARLNNLLTFEDITDRINSFGRTKFVTYNVHPEDKGDFDFPSINWRVENGDEIFTQGHANEIWQGLSPLQWNAIFTIEDKFRDPELWQPFVTLVYNITEVNLGDQEAEIISLAPLARHWAKFWKREDRHDTDWNAISQGVIL